MNLSPLSRHSKSNPIELNFNQTKSNSIGGLSSAIERNRTHRKEKKLIEPNRTFDFRTRDLCKTDVENPLPDLRSSSYFSPEYSARVFRKRRNSAEMASDALWIVSFKCIVKGPYLLTHLQALCKSEVNTAFTMFATHLHRVCIIFPHE